MKPLVQPDLRQARALQDLRHNPDVVKYLQACRETSRSLCVNKDGDDFRVAQGQARTYESILKLILDDAKAPARMVPNR
jgi:hypothetical protein